jgi:hypothetical protein
LDASAREVSVELPDVTEGEFGSSNVAVTPWQTRTYRMPFKIDSFSAVGHSGFTARCSPQADRWIRAKRSVAGSSAHLRDARGALPAKLSKRVAMPTQRCVPIFDRTRYT